MNIQKIKKIAKEAPTLLMELVIKRRHILSFLRYVRVDTGGGTIDRVEFSELRKLAEMSSDHGGPIIGIGTLFGLSCQALALGKDADQVIFTVDRFSWNPIGLPAWRHRELTHNNLAFLIESGHVRMVEKAAHDFYREFSGDTPALVFIDAGHSYDSVSQDIDWAINRKAYIICGDDFSHAEVKKAVLDRFGSEFECVGDMWIQVSSFNRK